MSIALCSCRRELTAPAQELHIIVASCYIDQCMLSSIPCILTMRLSRRHRQVSHDCTTFRSWPCQRSREVARIRILQAWLLTCMCPWPVTASWSWSLSLSLYACAIHTVVHMATRAASAIRKPGHPAQYCVLMQQMHCKHVL